MKHNNLRTQQNNSFKLHIFDASHEYHIKHWKNTLYDEELEKGNFILVDCVLEKFVEARGARLKKVAFKLLGIGFIDKGIPSSNEMSSISTSPSNCTLCTSSYFIFACHNTYNSIL